MKQINPLKNLKKYQNFKRLQINVLVYDFCFFSLGGIVFFHQILGVFIAAGFIFLRLIFSDAYLISNDDFYLNPFVDLLNFLNSHLFTGVAFENALLNIDENQFGVSLDQIHKAVKIGVSEDQLYEVMAKTFPIEDMRLYCQMLQSGRYLGVNPAVITSSTLVLLSQKKQTMSEIYQILYQKRMEQMILTFAPMAVILFIDSMSKDFLSIMYETIEGKLIMAISFLLIVIMKIISEKIVQITI